MLTAGVLVIGTTGRERSSRFWREALGYVERTDGFGGWASVLVPPDGDGLRIALQRSEEQPQEHPRLHLDLHVRGAAELAAETGRLVGLGASRADWDLYPDDPDFIVLADPDGNRFCIVDLLHGQN